MATPHADTTPPLSGRRILICRPEPEASRLAGCFRAAGADTRTFPLIERQRLPETPERRTLILNLDQFTHIIVVSPYAARLLLDVLDTWWPQLPAGIRWYAVGSGTASVLTDHGISTRKPAAGWTSEALLALPSLAQLSGERVLLARGEDGRELIRHTLEQRGAQVTPLALYRRRAPDYTGQEIQSAINDFEPDAIVALSGETLNNLIALCGNSSHNLHDRLLIVPAARVAEQARAAGFVNPCIPGSLADTDIVACVAEQLRGRDGGFGSAK
ncbi:uroporphyrinogen-III synthase [Marinobacter salinisoli]|uniref:Uroporphyrinogen-III synthase n=1 Tax=Marinobacter salinisoli TaxID=2769486 RepID=A0ABX7MUM4_9GAMM|nr:uroporphyrinogen-III synthase [Marinobacter salinisoli]QSP95873.1 uroporphyrinogen-III synthase [Marinobacter salinisoli]